MAPSRLASLKLLSYLKVDRIAPFKGKLCIPQGVSQANEINGVNVSHAAPPKEGYTLRTSSSNTAEWKPPEVQVSDLPYTGVQFGVYTLATIEVDAKGRIVKASDNYQAPQSFKFAAQSGIKNIIKQTNHYAKTGYDTTQVIFSLELIINPNTTNITLTGLPNELYTGLTSSFGNVVSIKYGNVLHCGLAEVHHPNVLIVKLPFSSISAQKIKIVGDLIYQSV